MKYETWKQGYDARSANLSREVNPYAVDSPAWLSWENGYTNGEFDLSCTY